MNANNKNKFDVKFGPTWRLVSSFEETLNDNWEIESVVIKNIALQSARISPKTALHKVLYQIAYKEFYLNSYDDLDWVVDEDEAVELFEYWAPYMGIKLPHHYKTLDGLRGFITREKFKRGLNFLVDNSFAILWNQKKILFEFNKRLAEEIAICKQKDYPKIFQSDGYLNRVAFPLWLKKQILYRDRGYCQHCGNQVESVDLVDGAFELDHMVPLKQGGTNDPTNLILSCKHCNTSKGDDLLPIKDIFAWPERRECCVLSYPHWPRLQAL